MFIISTLLATASFSQGGPKWSTGGNSTNNNDFLGTTNNNPLVFKTNNIEALQILPSGDVGIGTSSPSAKLDVAGNINASVHDSQALEDLLTEQDEGQDIYADSAYSGKEQEKTIAKFKMNNKVHEKGYKKQTLNRQAKSY